MVSRDLWFLDPDVFVLVYVAGIGRSLQGVENLPTTDCADVGIPFAIIFCIFVTTTTQIQTFIVYYVFAVETHRADVFFASQVFSRSFYGISRLDTPFPCLANGVIEARIMDGDRK